LNAAVSQAIHFALRETLRPRSLGETCRGLNKPRACGNPWVREGPIRLLNGVQGHTGGFGCAHIESYASRVSQIQSMGFRGVHDYVRSILSDTAFAGTQEDGRISIVSEKGRNVNHLICQWDEDLLIWSVTTAIPKRHMRGINILWRR
jgi:hypothetical protein